MPTRPRCDDVTAASRAATLLRIYRSAVRSGDDGLRLATELELRSNYGVEAASHVAGATDAAHLPTSLTDSRPQPSGNDDRPRVA